MKRIALGLAAILISGPAMAAEITFNGWVTQTINQTNQRVDAFQTQNAAFITPPVNSGINGTQALVNSAGTTIKGINPFGNAPVPPNFTILPR